MTCCPARVPTGCEEVPNVLVMLCRGLTIEVYLYLSFVDSFATLIYGRRVLSSVPLLTKDIPSDG